MAFNQGGQGLYRGSDNKKVKLSKADKVHNALQKDRARIEAGKGKKPRVEAEE